jgi:hypothetical protein
MNNGFPGTILVTDCDYYSWCLLLLKNDGLFFQTRYPHEQAAILLKPFHRFFRGRDLMRSVEKSRRYSLAN